MSMTYNTKLVCNWATDRNLIEGSTPKAQFLKFVEEGGEIFEAILKRDKDLVVDAIGDNSVVTTILLLQTGHKPEDYIVNLRPSMHRPFESFEVAVCSYEAATLAMAFGQYQGELSRALAKEQDIIPSVIKVIETLQALCVLLCIDFGECYRLAYNEIKDRKGRMVDGVFVKEGD